MHHYILTRPCFKTLLILTLWIRSTFLGVYAELSRHGWQLRALGWRANWRIEKSGKPCRRQPSSISGNRRPDQRLDVCFLFHIFFISYILRQSNMESNLEIFLRLTLTVYLLNIINLLIYLNNFTNFLNKFSCTTLGHDCLSNDFWIIDMNFCNILTFSIIFS